MPAGRMRLCPENGTHLVNPFENADHNLLVKLGALSQIGIPAEVVEFENVGSAFGCGLDNLWTSDFRKSVFRKVVPERFHQRGRKSKSRLLQRVPQPKCSIIQKGVEICIQDGLVYGERCYDFHPR